MIYVITGFVTFIVTGVINLYHNQSGVKYGHSQLMFHTQIYKQKTSRVREISEQNYRQCKQCDNNQR